MKTMDITLTFLTNFLCATMFVHGNEQNLEIWELRCLNTHNALRVAHGLNLLSWSPFLHRVADVKSFNVLLNDNNLTFQGPTLSKEILDSELITINYEIATRHMDFPDDVAITPMHRQLFFSYLAYDMVQKWYNKGLFSSRPEDLKSYARIMDVYGDKIGCTLHGLPLNETSYRVYLTVAYQQDKEKVSQSHKTKERLLEHDIGSRFNREDRTCNANCTNIGSCYSHRSSAGYVASRVGDQPRSHYAGAENCRCEADATFHESDMPFLVPYCVGPCFVNCPLATAEDKRTCYGDISCTCVYSKGGAVCQ